MYIILMIIVFCPDVCIFLEEEVLDVIN